MELKFDLSILEPKDRSFVIRTLESAILQTTPVSETILIADDQHVKFNALIDKTKMSNSFKAKVTPGQKVDAPVEKTYKYNGMKIVHIQFSIPNGRITKYIKFMMVDGDLFYCNYEKSVSSKGTTYWWKWYAADRLSDL